jgi:hypothetical protein
MFEKFPVDTVGPDSSGAPTDQYYTSGVDATDTAVADEALEATGRKLRRFRT